MGQIHPLGHLLRDAPKQDKYESRARLESLHKFFTERAADSEGSTGNISLAEGGCLLPPHPGVSLAMHKAAYDFGIFPSQIYPQNNIYMPFIEAIEKYFTEECGIPYDENMSTVIGFGSSHIFDGVLSTVCNPGDVVLAPSSFYHAHADWPTKWGAHLERINTFEKNGYKLTAQDLKTWIENPENEDKNLKCLVFTNPTTTGAIYSKAELDDLAEIIRQQGLLVFSDEVFKDTEFADEKVISLASLPGMNQYVVTGNSGSKTRGVADLRLGWACGPSVIIDPVIKYMERTVTEIPLYLQNIGKAVIESPRSYLDEARKEYRYRVDLILQAVEDLNASLNDHWGTENIAFIKAPLKPKCGHYIMLNFDELRGFQAPSGHVISDASELVKFFGRPDSTTGRPGVLFSSGFTKGHDDLTLYAAFAQNGYKTVNEAYQPYLNRLLLEQAKSIASGSAETNDPESMPDLSAAYEQGRNVIREAFHAVFEAIKGLEPTPAFKAQHNQKGQLPTVQDGTEKLVCRM